MKQLQQIMTDLVNLVAGKGATDEFNNPLSYSGVTTSTTATPNNVSSSVTAWSLLPANPARKGAFIYNDSTAILYLLFGSSGVVSATNYTTQVGPQTLFEVPVPPLFTGVINGVWAAANGFARVTELT